MIQRELFDYVMNTPHNTNPAILKQKIKEISGASSWNDLKDKPFYEEVTEVGGDTLTWDGNTEGLVNANNVFYKVSDALPNESDFSNRYIIVTSEGETIEVTKEEYGEDFAIAAPGILMGMNFIVVYEAGTESGEMTFPETGLYVYNDDESYLASLTIPGYTGFVSKQTVVKPIETKYLPEHLQFGEVTENEPLEISWNGNTAGLVSVSPDASVTLYKVADDTPTKDQLEKGFTFVVKENIGDRVSREYTEKDCEDFSSEGEYAMFTVDGSVVGFVVAYKDGATFPEKGLYLVKTPISQYDYNHIVSLKFNFEQQTTVIKQIDPKYVPGAGPVLLGELVLTTENVQIDGTEFTFNGELAAQVQSLFKNVLIKNVRNVKKPILAEICTDDNMTCAYCSYRLSNDVVGLIESLSCSYVNNVYEGNMEIEGFDLYPGGMQVTNYCSLKYITTVPYTLRFYA